MRTKFDVLLKQLNDSLMEMGELVKNMESARGKSGFGYDPILYIPEYGRTVAELSEEEKNLASHRGKAGRVIARIMGNRE